MKRNTKPADNFVSQITATWRKAVESIIETGGLLIAAKEQLHHGEFQKMIQEKLPFGPRTAQMLMTIAKHPVIGNAKYVSHLPPSWGALYDLTMLPHQELLGLIEDGYITPETQRSDIKNFGFYMLQRVPTSLRVLMQYAETYPNPDDLVPDFVIVDSGRNFTDGFEMPALAALPAWIKKLHVGLERYQEERNREFEATIRDLNH